MAQDYPAMPAAPKDSAPAGEEEYDFMDGEDTEEAPAEEDGAPTDLSKISDDDLIAEAIKRGLADEIEDEVEEKGDAAEEVAEEAPAPEADKKYSNEGSSFENPFDLAK